jgi:outer membrane protein assembly factor BamB
MRCIARARPGSRSSRVGKANWAPGNVLVAGTYTELIYGIAVDTGKILWKFKAGMVSESGEIQLVQW